MNGTIRETSSIGATWPPAQATHNRIRGFYPEMVDSKSQIDTFVREFECAVSLMDSHPEVSRLSIRLVAGVGIISLLEDVGIKVEAAYPLVGMDREAFVVYTCRNDPPRQVHPDIMTGHARLLETAISTQITKHDPYDVLTERGYDPKILPPGTNPAGRVGMAPQFMELYGKFGFSELDVETILGEPANTIAYLLGNNKQIVSTVLAERVQLEIADIGTVNVTEISEAATLPSLEGRGLYRNLSGLLVRHLIEVAKVDGEPIHALYGECNLSSEGVIFAARRNARRFSVEDSSRLGVRQPNFGILEQNFKVNDGHEIREYNDFALTYVEL